MRAVIQRVTSAWVSVGEKEVSRIGNGILLLLGVETSDSEIDAEWLASKVVRLRIFSDEDGQMNRSLQDIDGEILVVSQFTLHAQTKKGNRPSFVRAARSEAAQLIYESFVRKLENALQKSVRTGIFGADMQVSLCNDGPVTIFIDTQNKE